MRKITLILFLCCFAFTGYSQGEDCTNPIAIASLPYTTSDDTANYGDDYENGSSPCSLYYMSGDDVFYTYTPAADEVVTFSLTNISATYSGIHVLDGCVDASPACVAFSGNGGSADRVLSDVALTSGVTYYIVISTWASPQSITYDLTLTQVTCPSPSDLDATNVGLDTADLSWTDNAGVSTWNVELGETGFTPTGTPTDTGVANPFMATSLTPATTYEYYVQADCGGGDASDWSGPFSFTTLCPLFTPDYNADMSSNVPSCWEEANSGDSTTGPMDLGAGLWYSSNHNGTPSNVINLYTDARSDWIISPVFDLSTSAPSELNVYVALTENGTSGSGADLGSDDRVQLLMTTDGGTTWADMQSWSQGDVPTDIGEEITFDLSAISGNVQFAFLGSEGTVDDAEDVYFHVSKFQVRETPSCLEPNAFTATNVTDTTVELAWMANGSELLWDIEVVDITATGTVTGTPTTVGVTTNPYTLSGLTANNAYEVYVRADCNGSVSAWTGPVAFTTECAAIEPGYSADMSVNVPDSCWKEAGSGDTTTGPMEIGASDWRQGTSYAYGASNAINLYFDNDQEWLLSPTFDLSGGGPYQLDMNVAVTNWNAGTVDDTMGSDDEVQLLMSTDGGTTWTNVTTWNAANEPLVGGTDFVEDLTAITGNVQFAIYATDGTVDDLEDYDFHIGRFEVRTIPSCSEPTGLSALVTGLDTVDLSWTAGGSETEWSYDYGVSPYMQGDIGGTSGTVMTTPSLSLSGLTPGESYDIYIQANCGGSESIYVTTSWSNPNIGDTCDAPIEVTTLPYNTSDDTANYGDDYTGVPGTTCGSTFSYLNGDDVVYAYTATADGTINVALSSIGSTYSGMFVYTDCANIGTECVAGNGNGYSTADYDYDVSVTNGTTYYIVISTWASPQSTTYTLDITEILCADPSALTATEVTPTSANLGWTENGTSASWNIELGASGFTPTGTATATSGTNPYPAMGLTANTAYEFYVQSDCGASQSAWVGPYEFTTACDAIATDYAVDMSANVPDSCWNEAGSGEVADGPMGIGASDWKAGRAFTDLDSNVIDSNVINLYQNVDREWLISPSFDLDAMGNVGVLVKVAVTNYSFAGTSDATDTDVMGSDDEVQLVMTTDGGATWTNVTTWNVSNQPDVTGTDYILDLTGMTGSVQFAFFASDGATDDSEDYDFHVGAFEVSAAVLSTNDFNNQLAFTYYPNPVENTLTLNAQNTIDSVIMFNMLGQEVLRATPNTVDSNIDMSSLETGTYFVQVSVANITKTVRVIKK